MHQNILNPKRDFTITVQGCTLFGLIPLPKEELAIDLNVSRRLEGQPLQSIPKQTYQYVLMAETLNIAIREKPEALANLADWIGDLLFSPPRSDVINAVAAKIAAEEAGWLSDPLTAEQAALSEQLDRRRV